MDTERIVTVVIQAWLVGLVVYCVLIVLLDRDES